ncbi:glycoside hydrolase family 3 C-terminal domain-containing protein [Streptomyces sp. RB6PN25]|uniref:Glycoside hydrolase family 3 C-terminal domain-containing protein n=1 Tax=Streptomyces humicola TaxID=2953240 RepID=A0ABT1PPW7_9ACTN|nr:glycoside hydrolase family 3 C-terminal domain-containing protein [Streptomyces humicola]MCQ4079727.1 glycoside hydrolase family 3 C-terminal domain-containing protein [Streptomyces humicola]
MTDHGVSGLSLEQQASLTSGSSTCQSTPVPDIVRAVTLADGPHGIRRQPEGGDALGVFQSIPATCFPPAVSLGSSWDPELVRRIGAALGREASALDVDVVLGPGVNIKRHPLCGRNFEYFSEDPHLTGAIGAAMVAGIQSTGIGACVKHFAVNNQETDRMRVSADVDEQALREIYLPAFEHIIRESTPSTVMCSYNKINGVYASQNRWLLTKVLREEWGFDGLVMSDWGAVNDRVAALAAGLDLEMPPTGTDQQVVDAVKEGRLDPAAVAASAARVAALAARTASAQPFSDWDVDAHHELAREAARAGAVLLKNDGDLLPLDPTARQRIAVIGEFVRTPRYQGSGSSHVVPTRLDTAWDALQAGFGPETELDFAPGYRLDGTPDDALVAEAVATASACDTALVFLGLPDAAESEGFDRTTMDLPGDQLALLRQVSAACPRVAVVLANGGVVSVAEWQDHTAAILEGWLGGQASGQALADLLLGAASPSGRLAETIPLRLADVPSHLHFPGRDGHVDYGEGRYVGYRYYDTLDRPVAYPFGHGLNYTRFEYTDLTAAEVGRNEWRVNLTVRNVGHCTADEVVQLYVAFDEPQPTRPRRELRGFAKVRLEPGQSTPVAFTIRERDLAQWSTGRGRWRTDAGTFAVEVGASSRDIRLRAELVCAGDGRVDELSAMSTLGEWLDHPVGNTILSAVLERSPHVAALTQANPTLAALAWGVPLAKLTTFGIGLTAEGVDELVAAVRQADAQAG